MSIHRRKQRLFEPSLVKEALRQSFVKLNPRILFRNPVMFTVEIGTVDNAGSLYLDTEQEKHHREVWCIIFLSTAILFITLVVCQFCRSHRRSKR